MGRGRGRQEAAEKEEERKLPRGHETGTRGLEWGQFVTRPPVEAAGSYFLFAVCAYLPTTYIRTTTYYVGEPPADDRGHG